jgi:hypothetical protein
VSVVVWPAGQASTTRLVLEARMASRREQSPSLFSSSAKVLTVMFAARAGRLPAPPRASSASASAIAGADRRYRPRPPDT